MLFRKTPTNESDNYAYRFSNGTVFVITEGNETAVWIKMNHSLDDAAVHNNIKNSGPQLRDWPNMAVEEWKTQHLNEETEQNRKLSVDRSLLKTKNQDTSIYAEQLAEITADEPDPHNENLFEILSELSEEDQGLCRLYFIEVYSQEEIAKMKGVLQNTIPKKIHGIKKQLTEMFSRMDKTLEVKSELKKVRNTKKKPKAKRLSFAEVEVTVVNKLPCLNLAKYANLFVKTAVYTVVRDVTRRTMEIIIELFTYETENQIVIFAAYGLIWICIFWRWRYAIMSIFQVIWYGIKKLVKKIKGRHRAFLVEDEK